MYHKFAVNEICHAKKCVIIIISCDVVRDRASDSLSRGHGRGIAVSLRDILREFLGHNFVSSLRIY